MNAYEVFTPNDFPTYTYISRDSKNYEKSLVHYLKVPGSAVAISGPSKSGKTSLVRRVVGDGNLVLIPGSSVSSPDALWDRVLDKIRAPHETATQQIHSASVSAGSAFPSGGSVAKLSATLARQESRQAKQSRRGYAQVVDLLAKQPAVVLVDDFHFIDRDIQIDVAPAIKAAVHDGVKFIITVASHRSDDLERATDQLTGRVANLDIEPWSRTELEEIVFSGFEQLNAAHDILVPYQLSSEAGGSPQLMQLICLHAAIDQGFEQQSPQPKPLHIDEASIPNIMKEASNFTQMKTTADKMLQGPKSRGTSRDIYELKDGTSGDVYYCVAKAIASFEAQLSFTYEQIKDRIERLASTAPPGGSIHSCLAQMSHRTANPDTGERKVDWDEEKRTFNIVDPYLLFYIRWSSLVSK